MVHPAEKLNHIWAVLEAAARRPGTALTLLHLATIGSHLGPRVRAVILRDFRRGPERLYFATHARSAKVAEISAHPRVALTGYTREQNIQLRLEGQAGLVEEVAERQRAWEALASHSRQAYVSTATPGEPVEAQIPGNVDEATAFARFAWVRVELDSLEWLELAADPHRRWRFLRQSEQWRGQRVVP